MNVRHTARPGLTGWACLLLLAALVGGCSVARMQPASLSDRLPPPDRPLTVWRADRGWWTIYNDPALNRLVETALAANVDLALSAINVNRALYRANLVGADLVPSFSGDLSASAGRNLSDGGPSSRSVGGDVGVSYEIDLWRRLSDSASAREWEYRATTEDREAARLALVNSVVDVYFNLAYLSEAIAVTRDNIANYQKIAEIATARHGGGKAAGVEPAQARQSLLSAENELLDLETRKKSAEQTLRDLLNARPGTGLPEGYPSLLDMRLPDADLNVPLAVLGNRPDLRAAEYRLRSTFKDLDATEKDWYPSVTVGASLSSSSDALRTAFDVPFAGGNLRINLPFLDWNRVYWNVKIAQADYEAARLEFEQAITTALNEVDTYKFAYDRARDTVRNTDAKYLDDLTVTAYYRDRYTAGAGELSDYLAALNTEAGSRLALLNSRYAQIQYENLLYKSLAGRYTPK